MMKAEYINTFLGATKNIIGQMAQIDLVLAGTKVKTIPVSAKNVVIMVGITGDLRGMVAIGMDNDFAKKIASNMMMGMEVPELNELAKSALKELSNILMGQVATIFEGLNKIIDITPPTLVTGENISLSLQEAPLLSLKFKHEDMDLEFDISIEEQ